MPIAGSAVNNIVNNKNHDQKRIKIGNRLTLLQSHSHLKTSFPIPSGQIPVPATQIPFSQSKNRSIPVPILPLQDPLILAIACISLAQ